MWTDGRKRIEEARSMAGGGSSVGVVVKRLKLLL